MIVRKSGPGWDGVPIDLYKNEPGTWQDVSRHILFSTGNSAFETRCFELAPGGYSSHEKHEHEHCVVVLSGCGKVLLDDQWHLIGPEDVVIVEPWQPHQFAATEGESLRILCIVNRDRDRPVPIENSLAPRPSNH